MRPSGEVVITPGQTAHAGGVEAHYDEHAWIGNREVGHRGAALALTIDRAEVGEHDRRGGQIELSAGMTEQRDIGPYRIDVRASDEDPPERVTVHAERRACPDHTVLDDPALPLSMWVSTEAIRQHTIVEHGRMLQIGVLALPDHPQLEVSLGGFRHRIDPRPGTVRAIHADDRVITIDRVVPGPATRFDGTTWRTADGAPARVHARVRVEVAPPMPPTPAGAATACGGPASHRSALPAELARALGTPVEGSIAPGERRAIDGVELEARARELAGPGEQPRRWFEITSGALVPSTIALHDDGVRFARAEHGLFVFDGEGVSTASPSAQVRSFALACPRTLALPVPAEPTYVWLSTIGHARVTFGAADTPALTLDLQADPRSPGLSLTSEHAYDSRTLAPQDVGHVATMDGLRIAIVDVVAGEGTRRVDYGWTSAGPIPIVHVQVRVERE